jgi:hypothetical protein
MAEIKKWGLLPWAIGGFLLVMALLWANLI